MFDPETSFQTLLSRIQTSLAVEFVRRMRRAEGLIFIVDINGVRFKKGVNDVLSRVGTSSKPSRDGYREFPLK